MTFNQFANGRFPRTEPRSWRDIPWREDRRWRKSVLKVLGLVLLWIFIAGAALYSISHDMDAQRKVRVLK